MDKYRDGLYAGHNAVNAIFEKENAEAQTWNLSHNASKEFFNGSRNGTLRSLRVIDSLIKRPRIKGIW